MEHWPCKNEATLALWADSLLSDRYILSTENRNPDKIKLGVLGNCAQWLTKSPKNALGYPNVLSRCQPVWRKVYKKVCDFNKANFNNSIVKNYESFLNTNLNYSNDEKIM